VQIELLGLGELAFEAGFELMEYAGALHYTPGETQVTGTVQLARSGEAGKTLAGPVVLTKGPGTNDLLQLGAGAWSNEGVIPWTYAETPVESSLGPDFASMATR
jgi:hypothetical protein